MTTPILPDDRRHLTHAAHHPAVVVAGAFILLAVGFWVFQVAQHKKFEEMAENNHMRRLPLPAPRGVLFDRNGKVLVENRNTFNIALVREQTKNLDETLHVLAMATGVDEAQLQRDRQPSASRAELQADRADRERDAGTGGGLSTAAVGIARNHYQEVPARKYPASELAAHLFGYVSEISETPADAR